MFTDPAKRFTMHEAKNINLVRYCFRQYLDLSLSKTSAYSIGVALLQKTSSQIFLSSDQKRNQSNHNYTPRKAIILHNQINDHWLGMKLIKGVPFFSVEVRHMTIMSNLGTFVKLSMYLTAKSMSSLHHTRNHKHQIFYRSFGEPSITVGLLTWKMRLHIWLCQTKQEKSKRSWKSEVNSSVL